MTSDSRKTPTTVAFDRALRDLSTASSGGAARA
jgi:hypothetical protein